MRITRSRQRSQFPPIVARGRNLQLPRSLALAARLTISIQTRAFREKTFNSQGLALTPESRRPSYSLPAPARIREPSHPIPVMKSIASFLNAENYLPHGYCLLWQPEIVWLHVLSDAAIATA